MQFFTMQLSLLFNSEKDNEVLSNNRVYAKFVLEQSTS